MGFGANVCPICFEKSISGFQKYGSENSPRLGVTTLGASEVFTAAWGRRLVDGDLGVLRQKNGGLRRGFHQQNGETAAKQDGTEMVRNCMG